MRGILGGKSPDITPAQIIGTLISNVGPTLVLLGVDLSTEQTIALGTITASGLALIGADAVLRVGRNVKEGAVQSAAIQSDAMPPDAAHEAPFSVGEVADETGIDLTADDLPSDEEEFEGVGDRL